MLMKIRDTSPVCTHDTILTHPDDVAKALRVHTEVQA
jgi:hypothetical protein